MILNYNKSECCGCTACYNICPKSAITMEEDSEGFMVPVIDQAQCIDCGHCRKVCGFKQGITNKLDNQAVYAVKRKNSFRRMESQSGGAFSAVAESFLKQNNIVYGVSMDESLNAVYTRISSHDELKKLKGSKYVQAIVGEIYADVEKDLKEKKTALFGGTPCHVDGLLYYLKAKKIDINSLYTYDLICHGVPSPKLFKDYIKLTEAEYQSKVVSFNFRDKMFGWHGHKTSMVLMQSNKKIISENYVNLFYSHLELRSSCHKCLYTNINRISDITIADYWGIEKIHPEFDDNKGCSLMILNTEKGKALFDIIKSEIDCIATSVEQCMQPNLQQPTVCPGNRDIFWKEYYEKGFEYVAKKYCQYDISKDYIYSYRKKLFKYFKKVHCFFKYDKL